jgi:hypothetical protein
MTGSFQPKAVPCRGARCKAKVYWMPHPTTAKMLPWDDLEYRVCHFATCIDAAHFRKASRKKKQEGGDR